MVLISGKLRSKVNTLHNLLIENLIVLGDTGSTHALYLETIVEETSDDLRSERSSAATWLSDSDADSVIHVRGTAGNYTYIIQI